MLFSALVVVPVFLNMIFSGLIRS